ncbi:MAG: gephyrin-like molybdotransferase Glp [Candidatus Odinarchaeota archaeon]
MKYEDVRGKGFSRRIKLPEAIKACLDSMTGFPAEEINLRDMNTAITKRILREDIFARRTIPPFDRSAMDGYAVIAEDTVGASEGNPLILKVTGEVQIGQVPQVRVESGTAIKITTGAMIPEGANAVIMVEDTAKLAESNEEIEIYASVHPGKHIARAGEDVEKETIILKSGRRLKSVDRGFLLSAGVTRVKMSTVPSIAIFSTGNELVNAWETELEPGKIPDVNSVNLYELCMEEGWNPRMMGIVPDEEEVLRETILQASSNNDIILFSGGTSVGQKDLIPALFNELGKLVFHGIAMRPGGPVSAATIYEKIFFGLPGFPTATLISFHFVVRPVLLSLLGMERKSSVLTVPVRITRNVGSKLGRLDFLRIKIEKAASGELLAVPIQIGSSGIMRSMVAGNGIIPIPESSEGLKEGDVVEAIIVGVDQAFSDFVEEK